MPPSTLTSGTRLGAHEILTAIGAGTPQQLTFGGRNLYPIWTPDSRSITFQSDREGDRGIWEQPADGTGSAVRLIKAESGASYAPETWTPDGKTLLYRASVGAAISLRTFARDGSSSKPFEEKAPPLQSNVSLSPDGRWLAYSAQDGPTIPPHVFIQPFPPTPTGGMREIPADVATSPRWSHDGSQIFFDDGQATEHLMVIDVRASSGLNFGNATPIQTAGMMKPSATWRPYDVTSDDKRIIMVTISANGIARPTMNVVVNWDEELNAKVPIK